MTEFGLHLPGAREGDGSALLRRVVPLPNLAISSHAGEEGRLGHGWRVVPSFLSPFAISNAFGDR